MHDAFPHSLFRCGPLDAGGPGGIAGSPWSPPTVPHGLFGKKSVGAVVGAVQDFCKAKCCQSRPL